MPAARGHSQPRSQWEWVRELVTSQRAFSPGFRSPAPKLRAGKSTSSRPLSSLLLNASSSSLQVRGVWQKPSMQSSWRSRRAKIYPPSLPPGPAATSREIKNQNKESFLRATWAFFHVVHSAVPWCLRESQGCRLIAGERARCGPCGHGSHGDSL